MRWRIEFSEDAERQWRKLPQDVRRRIAPHIDRLADTPRPLGSKKVTDEESAYRIRVGDYRVVYRIEEDVLVVLVVRIGHRREVYRGR